MTSAKLTAAWGHQLVTHTKSPREKRETAIQQLTNLSFVWTGNCAPRVLANFSQASWAIIISRMGPTTFKDTSSVAIRAPLDRASILKMRSTK